MAQVARSLASLVALSSLLLIALSLTSRAARADADPPALACAACKCAADAPDCFVDGVGKASSAARAYRLSHRPETPHHLVALAEEITFLTVGTTWYWLARDKNLVDWDRPSAKQRFTLDVIRMDNNDFPINFTLHPWSGAAYYSAARMSGLTLGWSAFYAVGATIAWEYGIEFREKVSFNDLIFTPLPGITLGEFFSRLALYVNRFPGKPTLAQRVAGVLFGPMQAFSDAVTGQNKQVQAPADHLGYSAYVHHAFRFHAGLALQSTKTTDSLLADLGFDGAFVGVPSHLRPGRFRRFLRDGDFTRFRLSMAQGRGQRELDTYADLSLFGLYQQQITSDMRGGFFFVGTSLGYRYRRSLLDGFEDEVAATHLPGLALESALCFGRGLWLRLSYRLQPDFAGVRALAYDAWQSVHPDVIGKTVTEKHGYLYSFGVTSLLEATLTWSLVQLGGRAWFAVYNSVEGLDRSQEELTADPRGYDRLLDAESFLRLALGGTGLSLELNLLLRRHFSRLGGYQAEIDLLRGSARLGYAF